VIGIGLRDVRDISRIVLLASKSDLRSGKTKFGRIKPTACGLR
jgi:hypothetical protein